MNDLTIKTGAEIVKTNSEKIYVALGSEFDYSREFQMSEGVRLHNESIDLGMAYFEVYSLKEASKLVNKFIDKMDISSSNWTGGNVINEKGEKIALVSYNGRVWDLDGKNIAI